VYDWGEVKVVYCEYAKAESDFGKFKASVRECDGQTCQESIFSNFSVYEKCPLSLKLQKEGVSMNRNIESEKGFIRVH